MNAADGLAQARKMLAAGPCRIHAVGLGGVGMAGLAVLLRARGFSVSGCDRTENRLVRLLRTNGVPVEIGHDARHLEETDWFIYSAAVGKAHPERLAARARRLPGSVRGDVLAALSRGPGTVAVAGSHGKTTTAAILAHLLATAGRAPGFAIGGELPGFGGAVACAGSGPDLVVEADESDGTLRGYRPGIGVITNIDYDHMEHFENEDEFISVFDAFARQSGRLWYGRDHPGSSKIGRARPDARGFGFSAAADLRAVKISDKPDGQAFSVSLEKRLLGTLHVPLRGRHNILNVLAAMGPALERGCSFEEIRTGLTSFTPPRRRFERVFEGGGVLLVSDYAHHPAEIRALLNMTRSCRPQRIRAIFQPHRFTRTRALGDDFPPAFEGIDELIVVPVYAASEEPVRGGTSRDLVQKFPAGAPVQWADSIEAAWTCFLENTKRGDVLLLIGAGDIDRIIAPAVRSLSARFPPFGTGPRPSDRG